MWWCLCCVTELINYCGMKLLVLSPLPDDSYIKDQKHNSRSIYDNWSLVKILDTKEEDDDTATEILHRQLLYQALPDSSNDVNLTKLKPKQSDPVLHTAFFNCLRVKENYWTSIQIVCFYVCNWQFSTGSGNGLALFKPETAMNRDNWSLDLSVLLLLIQVVRTILSHWDRVTHICVGNLTIIGSDNGLSPGRRQAIIWTNAGILLIGPLGTNFSENLIEILTFSFTKMRLKVSSSKWRPFCLGLNVLNVTIGNNPALSSGRISKIKSSPFSIYSVLFCLRSHEHRPRIADMPLIWSSPVTMASHSSVTTSQITGNMTVYDVWSNLLFSCFLQILSY